MSDKITREEMIEWFGDAAPIEAINLVWNAPGDKTLGEIRAELRAVGEGLKSRTPGMVERVAKAIFASDMKWAPVLEHQFEENKIVYLKAARAAIEAMRDLPDDPGQRYAYGEYSRRTQAAMVDDALTVPSPKTATVGTTADPGQTARIPPA